MPRAVVVAVFLLSGVGLQLLGPQLLRQFIDQATGALPGRDLAGTAALFIGVSRSCSTPSASAWRISATTWAGARRTGFATT
jgi:hypothetical protein